MVVADPLARFRHQNVYSHQDDAYLEWLNIIDSPIGAEVYG